MKRIIYLLKLIKGNDMQNSELEEKINLIAAKIDEQNKINKILWIGTKNDFVKMLDVVKINTSLLTDQDICNRFCFPDTPEINSQNIKATRYKLRYDPDYNISAFWGVDYKKRSDD